MVHLRFACLVASALLTSAAVSVEIAPLNGTDVLLVDEPVMGFLVYKNTSEATVVIPRSEGQRFEIRRAGGLWEECVKPNPKDRPLGPSSYRQVFTPGEEYRWYSGRIEDSLCPRLALVPGQFELRVLETWDPNTTISSPPRPFVVEEPRGLDAEAQSFWRDHRRDPSFAQEFVRRFAATPYAAPYLIRRNPAERQERLAEIVAEAKRSGSKIGSAEYSETLKRFLARNPNHWASAQFRRDVFAAALARGDTVATRQILEEMSRRPLESDSASEARALLDATAGHPGNR